MTDSPDGTISIASDERARIPFAMIGVLVLITSTTAVTVLNSSEQSTSDSPNVALAVDRSEAAAEAATREAVTDGLTAAARAPVTRPDNDSSVGQALEPDVPALVEGTTAYRTDVFKRYTKLRIYLATQQRLSTADQRLQDGTTTNVSLPPVTSEESNITAAINRVDMSVGMYNDDVPNGTVDVTLRGVQITVADGNGTAVANRTTSINASVPTTVFQLHEKTQEYDTRLNTGFFEPGLSEDSEIGYGFARKFALRQYPLSWAKVYFDRFSPRSWDEAFDPTHDTLHTEILANDAIYSVQEATFGTTDSKADKVMRERSLCFALSTGYKLGNASPYLELMQDGGDSEAENFSEAFDETFKVGPADMWNATKQRAFGTILENTGFNEAGICAATRQIMRDETDNAPAPPVANMVASIFADRNDGYEEMNETVEVNVSHFVDAAYYEMLNEDPTAELEEKFGDDDRNVYNMGQIGQGDFNLHDVSEYEPPGYLLGEREDTFDDIVDDTYNVDVKVDESYDVDGLPEAREPAGNWNRESVSVTHLGTESVEVDVESTNETSTEDTRAVIRSVSIEVENRLEEEASWDEYCDEDETCYGYETTNDTSTATFTFNLDIVVDHSAGETVTPRLEASGIEHAFESGGPAVGEVPNFEKVRNESNDDVFGSRRYTDDELEELFRDYVDSGHLTEEGDLKDELDALYETDTSVDMSLGDTNHTVLRQYIEDAANETRKQMKSDIGSINISKRELATDEDTLEPIRENITERREQYVYEDSSAPNEKFENPKTRARAWARAYLINRTLTWTEEVEKEKQEQKNDAESEISDAMGGVDVSLDDALGFGEHALSGDVETKVGELPGIPQDRNKTFQISASPSYLSRNNVGNDELPAARTRDQGPADTDSNANFTGLTIKQDNFLPNPGFPLVPWPGLWYGTLSAWNIQIEGEYARFKIQTTTSGPDQQPTGYISSDRPVDLELDDTTVRAGKTRPINFSSQTLVVVVVPSYQVVSVGSPGIGDGGTNPDSWHSCSGTYPNVGPNVTDGDCSYIVSDD